MYSFFPNDENSGRKPGTKTRTTKVRVVRDFPNVKDFPDVGPRSPRYPRSPSFRPYQKSRYFQYFVKISYTRLYVLDHKIKTTMSCEGNEHFLESQ